MKAILQKFLFRWFTQWWRSDQKESEITENGTVRLSKEQTKILLLDQGEHVVFAPPGTGKTELLAHRLRRAIEQGVDETDIACLTFTNRAARNMEQRVGGLSKRVFVGNFHSYASRYLRQTNTTNLKRSILDEQAAKDLMLEAMDVVPKIIQPRDQGTFLSVAAMYCQYMNMVRLKNPEQITKSYLSMFKNKMKSLPSSRKISSSSNTLLTPESLKRVDAEYRRLKQELFAMDFDELLAECLAHMVHAPKDQQSKRQAWIQVDEAQDLNECQWEILRRMLKPGGHLVVFADREQAIYSFMGASSAALNAAVKTNKVHFLRMNYRSPAYLLHLYTAYAKKVFGIKLACETALQIPRRKDDLCLLEFKDSEEELRTVSNKIIPSVLRNKNRNAAILMRTNRGVSAMSKALNRAGINHFVVADFDLFKYKVTRDFMALLEVVGNPAQRMPWSRLFKKYGHVKTLKQSRKIVNDIFAAGLLPHWILEASPGAMTAYPPTRLRHVLQDGRLVVFDTETTGTDPVQDDIIQFAAVEIVNGVVGRELNIYLKTDQNLDSSVAVHGITREVLDERGLDRPEGLNRIMEFVGDSPIAAHNLLFDEWMLESNLIREKLPGFRGGREGFCSLEIARALDPHATRHTLDHLITRYDLKGQNSHDALEDVRATVELIFHLATMAEGRSDAIQVLHKTYQEVFERIRLHFAPTWSTWRDDWLTPLSFEELFERFLTIGEEADDATERYTPEQLADVRGKLLRHSTIFVGTRPLHELLGLHLRNYMLYRETDLILDDDRLVVSTVHRAKGLEFDSVILAQAHDSFYPSFYSTRDEAIMEDARCFYVAMTRAKRQLIISYATSNERGYPTKRTRFLAGLDGFFALTFCA